MTQRILLALVAATVLLAMGAVVWFGNGKASKTCKLAGCEGSVTFDLSSVDTTTRRSAATLKLCVNAQCTTTTLAAEGDPPVQAPLYGRTVRSASLTIVDADGNELAHANLAGEHEANDAFSPNGPDCEPVCWHLNLELVDGALKPN